MAIFSNQATLTWSGNSTTSNTVFGEILESLSVTKTALEETYTTGDRITYVVTLQNAAATPITGLTVTDDLGGYLFGGTAVYPLNYVQNTIALFEEGIRQSAPVVTAGPPMVITDINVPASGSTVIIYQAEVTTFADPGMGGTITNVVTVTGGGLAAPITATEIITAATQPQLTITKSLSPTQISGSERITYTFLIQNFGSTPVVATDNAAISDIFDPALTALTVTYEGAVWTQGIQYNYNPATGLFTTVPSQITVPAATTVQDPVTGAYSVVPGAVTLTVTGTI